MIRTTSSKDSRASVEHSAVYEAGALTCFLAYFISRFLPTMGVRHVIIFLGFLFVSLSMFDKALTVSFRRRNLILLGFMVCILASALLLTYGADLELIYRLCSFFILAVLFTFPGMNVKISVSRGYIHLVFTLVCLVCVLLSFSRNAYIGEGDWSYNGLTLGMTNPNLTGMMLSGCIAVMIILVPHTKYKRISLLLIIVLFYLLLLTNARSSIVTTFLLVMYVLLFSKRRVPVLFQFIAVMTPIIVVPIYLQTSTQYSELLFLGKPFFSGREDVFTSSINLLDTPARVLFGNLAAQRFDNAHNSFLTILVSLGVVGSLVAWLIFLNGIFHLGKSQAVIEQRLSLLSLLFVFIQSSAEATFLTGGFPTVIFIYLFILFGNEVDNHHFVVASNSRS